MDVQNVHEKNIPNTSYWGSPQGDPQKGIPHPQAAARRSGSFVDESAEESRVCASGMIDTEVMVTDSKPIPL